jgi:hypothetical protein
VKKILFTLLIFVFAQNVFGQGINFQGVARSANGTIIASSNISLRLSIISKNVDDTPEYIETKTVVTNAQGIFSIVVGDATNAGVTGNFKNIAWKDGIKFLKVEMDPAAGTNYINMGATQLQYVPYSFYSLGVDAANVTGVLPIEKGGTGFGTLAGLRTALNITNFDSTALSSRIDGINSIISYDTLYNMKFSKSVNTYVSPEVFGGISIFGTEPGDRNLAIGPNALNSNTTGRFNIGIGYESLSSNIRGHSNVAVGVRSLKSNTTGNYNSSFGFYSLMKNTDGSENTAVGNFSLQNNLTGTQNVAIGFTSLSNNTTGSHNIAVGSKSMATNSTGAFNSAFGYGSLAFNTTGSNNSSFGNYSLILNSTGYSNTAIGSNTLYNNTIGHNNTAIGDSSLFRNTTGSYNTAIGDFSGLTNTTGSNNLLIGKSSDVSIGSLSNATAIGNSAIVSASNTIQLGNNEITDVKTSGNITAKKYTFLVANAYNFSTGINNVNLSLSNIFTINLAGNITLTFSNGTPGTYIIKLIQDGTGSRTVTFPVSNWKWAGGSLPTLSTTANTTDIVSLIFDGTTYYAKIDKGFAIGSYINQNVSSTVTLSGKITKDTTLYAKDVNYLSGVVYITKGVTLTVEEGAKVQGKYGANVGALVICRGAKIIARGTAEKPIIFTSASLNPQSGDWGGIVMLGTAKVNQTLTWKGAAVTGLTSVEGGINDTEVGYGLAGSGDAAFPTGSDADNSGFLQYVRIEYAGYAFQPDNELNSLTMAGVGNGTTIDHIQVTYAKDDAYEWFGGTVNCKYLIAYKTQDDDFDTDHGYSGNVQFGIALRDSVIADISNSHAFESDNDGSGSDYTPKTTAVFSNMTAIGPRINPTSGKGNNLFYAGAQIRRNSGISIQNSIIAGWPRGITIDESRVITNGATYKNLEDSIIRLKNVTLAGNTIDLLYVGKSGASTNKTDADVLGIFSTPYYGNTILNSASADVLKLTQPFNYTNPDFTPFGSSSTGTDNIASTLGSLGIGVHLDYNKNGDFTDSKLQDAFFEKVTFRGAVATSGANQSWWKGWTVWR